MTLVNVETMGADIITEVSHEVLIGVDLPTSTPALNGSVYRLYPMIYGAGTDGYMEITTLGRGNTITFGATTATIAGSLRGYDRQSATGAVSSYSEVDSFVLTVDSIGADGAVSMSFTEDGVTTYFKGFVSADGSNMVLRLNEGEANDSEKLIGFMLAVKQ